MEIDLEQARTSPNVALDDDIPSAHSLRDFALRITSFQKAQTKLPTKFNNWRVIGPSHHDEAAIGKSGSRRDCEEDAGSGRETSTANPIQLMTGLDANEAYANHVSNPPVYELSSDAPAGREITPAVNRLPQSEPPQVATRVAIGAQQHLPQERTSLAPKSNGLIIPACPVHREERRHAEGSFYELVGAPVDQGTKELWEGTLKARLSACLDGIVASWSWSANLLVIGRSMNHADTRIIILCSSKDDKKKIKRALKSTTFVHDLNHSRLKLKILYRRKSSIQPWHTLLSSTERSILKAVDIPDLEGAFRAGTSMLSGVRIRFEGKENFASIGGLLLVRGRLYAMTAGHAFLEIFEMLEDCDGKSTAEVDHERRIPAETAFSSALSIGGHSATTSSTGSSKSSVESNDGMSIHQTELPSPADFTETSSNLNFQPVGHLTAIAWNSTCFAKQDTSWCKKAQPSGNSDWACISLDLLPANMRNLLTTSVARRLLTVGDFGVQAPSIVEVGISRGPCFGTLSDTSSILVLNDVRLEVWRIVLNSPLGLSLCGSLFWKRCLLRS